jgi:hypothetical protein
MICAGPAQRFDRRAIDCVPELHDGGMLITPPIAVCLNDGVARIVVLWREIRPGTNSALVTEGEIGDLAIWARFVLTMSERAANDPIRVVVWIAGKIKLGPGVDLIPPP